MASTTIVYHDDEEPGITRKKMRHGWGYFDPEGNRITDRDEIDRLNAIGLPPAYRDAWFCPDPSGHIQAVGWDEKGRKQYRYHPEFRAAREDEKYNLCAAFGRGLPKLRKRVEADLKKRAHTKEKTIAAIIKLLDTAHLRIGNETYAKSNKSFGVTTLRDRHARIKGGTLKLQYKAKSGKLKMLTITDGSLARFVKKCQDLPGQKLFQYVDADGEPRAVTSSDVNAYIKEAMGADFTAKHFHLGRECHRVRDAGRGGQGHQPQNVARAGDREARQHAGDRAQILCPPGADRAHQGRAGGVPRLAQPAAHHSLAEPGRARVHRVSGDRRQFDGGQGGLSIPSFVTPGLTRGPASSRT